MMFVGLTSRWTRPSGSPPASVAVCTYSSASAIPAMILAQWPGGPGSPPLRVGAGGGVLGAWVWCWGAETRACPGRGATIPPPGGPERAPPPRPDQVCHCLLMTLAPAPGQTRSWMHEDHVMRQGAARARRLGVAAQRDRAGGKRARVHPHG